VLLALSDAGISTIVVGRVGALGIDATFFAPTWAQKKIEGRKDLRAFRTAQRLVGLELGQIAYGCEEVLKSPIVFGGSGGTFMVESIPITDWLAHREVFSQLAPDSVWEALALVYLRAWKLLVLAAITTPSAQLEPGVDRFLTTLRDEARNAQAALHAAEPIE
jgi:hypothetical protein